ncbi:type I restriction system endonuclease [Tepidiphilus sp. HLB4]|uniref:Type I restriction-modification system endonuclease n=1 Tax=Deinococcus geothermalis (strain DSM 11300 / CIP 105573 / AG-3a) TaxID=319795 RepID=Q1IWS6_DEIGD|nr:type I restriction endonuclease [Deinococcus geothermalis]ABF46308.1 type I restriction-modification system endonuclease [Deinococcus geothermalis DSM 11300]
MAFLSEAQLETALLEQLAGLRYGYVSDDVFGTNGHRPERESHDEVVLRGRFEDAVARLNPGLPAEARQDAIRKVAQSELPALLEMRHPHSLVSSDLRIADAFLKERGL